MVTYFDPHIHWIQARHELDTLQIWVKLHLAHAWLAFCLFSILDIMFFYAMLLKIVDQFLGFQLFRDLADDDSVLEVSGHARISKASKGMIEVKSSLSIVPTTLDHLGRSKRSNLQRLARKHPHTIPPHNSLTKSRTARIQCLRHHGYQWRGSVHTSKPPLHHHSSLKLAPLGTPPNLRHHFFFIFL